MFEAQYFCQRRASEGWRGGRPWPTLAAAVQWCAVIKPTRGRARVVDTDTGRVVWEV